MLIMSKCQIEKQVDRHDQQSNIVCAQYLGVMKSLETHCDALVFIVVVEEVVDVQAATS